MPDPFLPEVPPIPLPPPLVLFDPKVRNPQYSMTLIEMRCVPSTIGSGPPY